jgi:hypothetical protein
MVRRVTVQMTDDLEPSTSADTTVKFGVDGAEYEIDLSSDNAARLRDLFEPLARAGRRIGGRRSGGVPTRHVEVGVDTAAVRAWAKSNGVELAARGRIPRQVVEQFRAAMD